MADSVAAAEVNVRSWRESFPAHFPDADLTIDRRAAMFRGRFGASFYRMYVAEAEGGVVGFVDVGRAREACFGCEAELYALYVLPERWGTGLGHRLLVEAGDVRSLWVLEGNARARAFYEAHGFRPDGASQVLDLGAPVPEIRLVR